MILYAYIMDVTRNIVDYIEELQASGRYTFTASDAQTAMSKTEVALKNAVGRLKKRGRLVTPRRGFYVIVPTEYRSAGAPPPSWYIEALMNFLNQPYYVGLLSAASIHGASHQQTMVFQVLTDRPTRRATIGRTRIEFHKTGIIPEAAITEVMTDTGTMRVSSPEATALDVVRFAHACGSWSNVATVLSELAERIDPDELYHAAQNRKTSEIQRLGYLLDLVKQPRLADPLLRVLGNRRFRPTLLAPDVPRSDAKPVFPWRIIPNETVEPDL